METFNFNTFNHFQYLFYCLSLLFFASNLSALNIAIEGMPGAGKTSSLIELIAELPEEFILLSETNPEPSDQWQNEEIEDQTQVYHQIWIDRMASVKILSKKSPYIFLFDRSYFSNLAFKYAFDALSGSNCYSPYLNLYRQDLEKEKFSLIIILDVDPAIGSYRRLSVENLIPFPWSEKQFLFNLRKFYLKELPKITSSQLIYINTDNLSSSEIKAKILEILAFHTQFQGKRQETLNTCLSEDLLIEFGKTHCLGEKHSKIINVFDCPTIYFLRHSVQIVDGKPVFFNNHRLKKLSQK